MANQAHVYCPLVSAGACWSKILFGTYNNHYLFIGAIMFSFLKPDPLKALRKSYDQKLEQAMQAQRKGDIKTYSLLTAESEVIWQQIEAIQKNQT